MGSEHAKVYSGHDAIHRLKERPAMLADLPKLASLANTAAFGRDHAISISLYAQGQSRTARQGHDLWRTFSLT